MGKKPKAGSAPRKAKEQKLEDGEQSERFIQTARELGIGDDCEGRFESAFKAIARDEGLPPSQKPKRAR